jgi:hypothetical protein
MKEKPDTSMINKRAIRKKFLDSAVEAGTGWKRLPNQFWEGITFAIESNIKELASMPKLKGEAE